MYKVRCIYCQHFDFIDCFFQWKEEPICMDCWLKLQNNKDNKDA